MHKMFACLIALALFGAVTLAQQQKPTGSPMKSDTKKELDAQKQMQQMEQARKDKEKKDVEAQKKLQQMERAKNEQEKKDAEAQKKAQQMEQARKRDVKDKGKKDPNKDTDLKKQVPPKKG